MKEWKLINSFDLSDVAQQGRPLSNMLTDVSGYEEVTIFLNNIVTDNDASSLLLLINGQGTDYSKTTTIPSNGIIRVKNEGRIFAQRMISSQNGRYWNTLSIAGQHRDYPWSQYGEKLETVELRMSASAYKPVSGLIEVFAR